MHPNTTPPRSLARAAGVLYLAIIVLGVWSEGFVRSAMLVPGDAAATAQNILEGELLFRLSFAADALMVGCDVALAIVLLALLKPAGELLASLATAFRLIQAAILGANLLHQDAALLILGGGAGLDPAQAMVSLQLQSHGYDLGLLFFGVNSLLVGALLWRSSFMPRWLGAGMGAAGVVYLVGSMLVILAPAASEGFQGAYLVPLLAESAFCLWLLFKGGDAGVRGRSVVSGGAMVSAQ